MSSLSLFLIASVAPAMLIAYWIYQKDRNPEPGGLLVKCLAGGILSAVCFSVTEYLLYGPGIYMYRPESGSSIILLPVLALVREGLNWLVLYRLVWRNPHYDEHYDGIVYSVFVALGFSLSYHIVHGCRSISGEQVVLALQAPMQLGNSIVMGYFFSLAYFGWGRYRTKQLWLSLLLPAGMSLLDFFSNTWLYQMPGTPWTWLGTGLISTVLLLLLWRWCGGLIRNSLSYTLLQEGREMLGRRTNINHKIR